MDKVTQAAKDVGVSKNTGDTSVPFSEGVCEVSEGHNRDMIGGDNDVVEVEVYAQISPW